MTTSLPEFLFIAQAEYDEERLKREGLTEPPDAELVLYATLEDAEAALGARPVACLVMVHVERMAGDGYVFEEILEGIWASPPVPPRYLWISERKDIPRAEE